MKLYTQGAQIGQITRLDLKTGSFIHSHAYLSALKAVLSPFGTK
jgi:hypothetical protein